MAREETGMASEKSNAGSGAPPGCGGLVNAAMGNHAYKETGRQKR